jgi:PAS domain S-box-containing protein
VKEGESGTISDFGLSMFRQMVDGAADGIALADMENVIRYANEAYHRLYGYEFPETIGTRLRDHGVPPSMRGKLSEVDKACREQGFWEGEWEILRKDGDVVPVILSTSAVRDESGAVSGRVCVLSDISALKETEAALERANSELQGYARTVSHDLKGPLTAIVLETQGLADSAEEEDIASVREAVAEAAEVIERNVDRCYTLIDDMLMLARLDQKPRKVEEIDLGTLVMDVIEGSSSVAEQKDVSFSIDENLGSIRAEELHMVQLFGNLIDNALVHAEADNLEVVVRRLPGEDNLHRFLVRDNGQGFDDAIEGEMFLPFTTCEKHKGIGVGLATVKRVIDLYGGGIRAYNDRGACFEFQIADWPEETKPEPLLAG